MGAKEVGAPLRRVKVCPAARCPASKSPLVVNWKTPNSYNTTNHCEACGNSLSVLEEVGFKTISVYRHRDFKQPRRVRICSTCPPRQQLVFFSWKGSGINAFELVQSDCIQCHETLVEFWSYSGRTSLDTDSPLSIEPKAKKKQTSLQQSKGMVNSKDVVIGPSIRHQVKVCPICPSDTGWPVVSWKSPGFFRSARDCFYCRTPMMTLEEVDSKTVERYQLKQWKKPKRLKLCLKCSPRKSSIIYSWKNHGAEGVAFLDSNEWSRCRVGGACGSPWSEFWDVDELANGQTRQEGETALPENTDSHKQQKVSELTLIRADRNRDQVKVCPFWEVGCGERSHNNRPLTTSNDKSAEKESVTNSDIGTATKRPRQDSDLGEQHHKHKAPRLDVPVEIQDVQDELNAILRIPVDRSLKITYVPEHIPDELKGQENWTMKVYFSGLEYQSQLIGTGMGDTKSIAAGNAARNALQNPLLEEIKAKRAALSQLANLRQEDSCEPFSEGAKSRGAGDASQDTQSARRTSVASRRPVPSKTNSVDIFTERNSRIWNSLSREQREPDTDSPLTSVSFGMSDTACATGFVGLAEIDQSKESRKENVPFNEPAIVPKEGSVQEDDSKALGDKLAADITASDTSLDLKRQAPIHISSALGDKRQLKLQTQDPRRRRDPLLPLNVNYRVKEGDRNTTVQQQEKRDDTEECSLAVGEDHESDVDLRRAQEMLEKVQTEGEGSLNDAEAAEMMALLSKHGKKDHIGQEEPRHSNTQQTHAYLEEISPVAMSSPLPPPPPSSPPLSLAPGLPSPARSPFVETRDGKTNQDFPRDQRAEKSSMPDTELLTQTTGGLDDVSTPTEAAPDIETTVTTAKGPLIRDHDSPDLTASATVIQSVPMSPSALLSPEATAQDDIELTNPTVSKIGQTTYVDSFGLLRVHPDLLRAFGIEPQV